MIRNDKFQDKIVLITGGAQGIGLKTAEQFGAAGAHVILTDINETALIAAKHHLESRHCKTSIYMVDVTNKEAVEAMAKEVIHRFGRLDILINNAGIGHQGELRYMENEDWQRLINVNMWGVLNNIYAFLPYMKRQGDGHIVTVSSGQAFFKLPTWGAYAAIKQAVGTINEILYYELKRYGIRVTTVYPFMVNTGFYDEVKEDVKTNASWASKLSMKLLPYYSQRPETVAKKIFRAVKRNKRVEIVSPLNYIGKYAHVFSPVSSALNTSLTFLLSKGSDKWKMLPGTNLAERVSSRMANRLSDAVGDFGFRMDEIMSGEHEYTEGFGAPGKHPFHFEVTWGTDNLLDWLNPFNKDFMTNRLEGTITVGGLCENVPCSGQLRLMYFTKQKIQYLFHFEVDGVEYAFKGEKRNIYPWTLPYSHTCCFGELREVESGRLISKSITHFRWNTLPTFLSSFRLIKEEKVDYGV